LLKKKNSDSTKKFSIVNVPFICNNIPAVPANAVCISQLKRFPELMAHIIISVIEGIAANKETTTPRVLSG
jgi:hypothetical protein